MVTRLLEPHEQRLITERSDLADRLQKLNSFLESPMAASICCEEHARLLRQQRYMTKYLAVLDERVVAIS